MDSFLASPKSPIAMLFAVRDAFGSLPTREAFVRISGVGVTQSPAIFNFSFQIEDLRIQRSILPLSSRGDFHETKTASCRRFRCRGISRSLALTSRSRSRSSSARNALSISKSKGSSSVLIPLSDSEVIGFSCVPAPGESLRNPGGVYEYSGGADCFVLSR